MIEVAGLTKIYAGQAALRGVSLTVPAGSILAVLGHNGSGKTTLVRILATLIRPTAGGGRVGGHDLVREREAVRRDIALVGHETQLYDDLTARENLLFATELTGRPVAADRIASALARVGLEGHADVRARALSSGMRRRLGLARAMLKEARILLLDEPFAGLDHHGIERFEGFLRGFREAGGSAVVVTHSQSRALAVADQVAVLSAGRVTGRVAGAEVTEAAVHHLVRTATDADG
jgi:heme exporter protein A